MPDSPRVWHWVKVTADKSAEEAVLDALGILDSNGTEIDTLGKKGRTSLEIVGYFDTAPPENEVRKVLNRAFELRQANRDKILSVEFGSVAEQDWLAEWKKHWKPTEAGNFVIAPPWDLPENSNKIVIEIEPAMAFGTGTHETTRLCLELITRYYVPGMSFLDVGTGTGILSIAAAKLNGESAVENFLALDTDADSVRAAAENAKLNTVDGVDFRHGSVTSESAVFDFVCANMTIDIIRPMLALLVSKTSDTLIISGILTEQEHEIRSNLSDLGFQDPIVAKMGEWIALSVRP
ncbi:MAG: 50S ribosomal protein L11 methyltransferase [Acidobacteriota bacterium]|nr:50S ribosomal protein L11 methyltransferase [Acidobacteriota bacterium]MDH3531254.1 50S ribosomal protein L11 methyltransferase [Acidobacteriota bacterium]